MSNMPGTTRRSRWHVRLLPIGLVVALAAPLVPNGRPATAATAIAFRSSTVATGATVSLAKPAGVTSGDVLVAAIAKHEQLGRPTAAPAGWTLVSEPEIPRDLKLSVYVKAAGSSEPPAYAWDTGDADANGVLLSYSGVDRANPVVASNADTGDARTLAVGSFQVPTASVLVQLGTIEGPSPNPIAPPDGFTQRAERTRHPSVNASDKPLGSPGGTGDIVARASSAATYAAAVLALRPAGGGVAAASAPGPAPAPVRRPAPAPAAPPPPRTVGIAAAPDGAGYWLAAADGGVFAFGRALFSGSANGVKLAGSIVGIASTPSGGGYWLVASDGGVFAFGDARFLGSAGGVGLARPVVGMASTPTGRGYWLVASDGGVFAFGDARFLGSSGGISLAMPVAGIAPTASGAGYRLTASDGGVFAFGDAAFLGSSAGSRRARRIVGVSPSASGSGYRLAGADGSVLSFGDAASLATAGLPGLRGPITGIAQTPTGKGWWLVASDGGVFAFGDAAFHGSRAAG